MEISLLLSKGSNYNFVIFRIKVIKFFNSKLYYDIIETRVAASQLLRPAPKLSDFFDIQKLENLETSIFSQGISDDLDYDLLKIDYNLLLDRDTKNTFIMNLPIKYGGLNKEEIHGTFLDMFNHLLLSGVKLVSYNVLK